MKTFFAMIRKISLRYDFPLPPAGEGDGEDRIDSHHPHL
jgi:hypothetical protein